MCLGKVVFMSIITFVRTYLLCASPMDLLHSCVIVLRLFEIYIYCSNRGFETAFFLHTINQK